MASRSVTCYVAPDKRKGLKIAMAFARGARGRVESRLRTLLSGPAAFYGISEWSAPIFAEARRVKREWFYIDQPYFGRGDYFRVTRRALQHSGLGKGDSARLARFGVEVKPWRHSGRHILVTTQSELWYELIAKTTRQAWIDGVVAALRQASDREIRLRFKPAPAEVGRAAQGGFPLGSFQEDLAEAWAVVTHSSNTAVEALLEGVPVFCTAPCAALTLGSGDLAAIETPLYPDGRAEWAAVLAANQWTRAELRDGSCWRALQSQR